MISSSELHENAFARDPVCGMEVDGASRPLALEHGGRWYRFCGESCRRKFAAAPADYLESRDPVCGMTVERDAARHVATHAGKPVFFCSKRCRERFEASPGDFVGHRSEPEPAPPGTRYTCPMDPEIVRDGPGDCPICGMALAPMAPSPDDPPNPELLDFRRRLRIGVPLGVALLVLEMGGHLGLPFAAWLGPRVHVWLQLALATPVVVWIAQPFFRRGWSSVVNRSPNMWTLIALGAGASYAFSVVAVLAPELFPSSVRGPHGLPPRLLRGCRGHSRPRPRRAGARAHRPRAYRGRHPGAARPRTEVRPAGRRGRRRGCADRENRRRRSASRPARRERPGRRGGARRTLHGGREHADRRVDSGGEGGGRPGDGGDPQPVGSIHDARRGSRRGHRPRSNRRHGRPGAAKPRPGAGAGGPRRAAVRAGGDCGRGDRVRGVARLRPRPGLLARGGGGGQRSRHRVSVRARARDADVDHGRGGPGRPGRGARSGRGGAGEPRAGRPARRRQDRHPDRGHARPDRRRRGGRRPGRVGAPFSRRLARARIGAPARLGPRQGCGGAPGLRSRGGGLPRAPRKGGSRPDRRARGRARQRGPDARAWHRPGRARRGS